MSSEIITMRPKPRTPPLPTSLVTSLARDLFGLHVHTFVELDSYLDRNYHLKVDDAAASAATPAIRNKFLGEGCAHGYVLKVFNAEDSRYPVDIRLAVALLQHVYGRGLSTPRLVPTIDGQPFVLCSFNLQGRQESYELVQDVEEEEVKEEKTKHAVLLVEYVPGVALASVPLTPRLCYQLGRQAATLDTLMQDFADNSDHVPVPPWSWKLENVACLRHFLDVIKDRTLRDQISDVIDAFETRMLKNDIRKNFKRGFIHSDYTTHNVLVSKLTQEHSSPMLSSPSPGPPSSTSVPLDRTDPFSHSSSSSSSLSTSSLSSPSGELTVSGIVDFGDLSKTYVLLEPAIAMSDVMLQCPEGMEPDELAGQVLRGYLSQMTLSTREVGLLPLAIRARFIQHLVLGRNVLRNDPHNNYVSTKIAPVHHHFSRFYHLPDDVILSVWSNVAEV